MIIKQGWFSWIVRAGVVILGLGLAITLTLASKDTGSVIAEYRDSFDVRDEIRILNPQSQEEFKEAFDRANKINLDNYSSFRLEQSEIIDLLTTTDVVVVNAAAGKGSANRQSFRKPWATDKFIQDSIYWNNYNVRWGNSDYEWLSKNPRGHYAAKLWFSQRSVFWTKLGSYWAAGLASIVLGMVFLPYLLVLTCFGLLLISRSGPVWQLPTDHNSTQVVSLATQDSGSDDDGTGQNMAVELPSQVVVWLPLVLVGLVTILRDERRTLRYVRSVIIRGPPKTRRSVMMRTIVIAFVVMALFSSICPLVSTAGQSLYFNFGEWQNARGAGVAWVTETQHYSHFPFLFLDGSVAEYLLIVKPQGNRLLTFGPVVGGQSKEDGFVPHIGFEIRGSARLGNWEPHWRYASRHTSEERLHNMTILGVRRLFSGYSVGLSYELIVIEDPLDHRIAASASRDFWWGTLIVEVRTSLDEEHRTSMNIDLSIPLK